MPSPGSASSPTSTPGATKAPWGAQPSAPAALSQAENHGPSTASPAQVVPVSPRVRDYRAQIARAEERLAVLDKRKVALGGSSDPVGKSRFQVTVERFDGERERLVELLKYYERCITDVTFEESELARLDVIAGGNGT